MNILTILRTKFLILLFTITILPITFPTYAAKNISINYSVQSNGKSSVMAYSNENARVNNKTPIQTIKFNLSSVPADVDVLYSVKTSSTPWSPWKELFNSSLVGVKGQNIQGIKFKLSGPNAKHYSLKYGGRYVDGSWSGYFKNGESFTSNGKFIDTFKMAISQISTPTIKNNNIVSNSRTLERWSHKDNQSDIQIDKKRLYDSDTYIAKIKISNAMQFKHVYANGSTSPNGELQTVTEMTKKYNPIIAINGGGFKDKYPVGISGSAGKIDYINSPWSRPSLSMGYNGKLGLIQNSTNKDSILKTKPFFITTFGPTLVSNGNNLYKSSAHPTNIDAFAPRTAIGQGKNPNEFYIVVVDGRSNPSKGVSLKQLANIFESLNCDLAYNLDGGGSSTLAFKGKVINKPSDTYGPRKVSDSLFIRNI